MENLPISTEELRQRTTQSYEHIRKIRNGDALPSRSLLKLMAKELKLPFKELDALRVADAIEKKHGTLPAAISGKNPELEPMARLWPLLNDDQREDMLAFAQQFVRRNRRSIAPSG